MKEGRCGVGAVVGSGAAVVGDVFVWFMALKGAGVRDAGTRKRWVVVLCGTVGEEGWCEGGEVGGEMRRRLLSCSVTKRISSSSSSSCSCCASASKMRLCSTDWVTPKPLSSSGGATGLDCDPSSMLSTRSNFRGGFGRGVGCVCSRAFARPLSALLFPCSSALCVRRCGVTTKRFAGVSCLNCSSGLSRVELVGLGVCTASALRRPDWGFGFAFWVDGGLGARKRRGDGVCVGILGVSFGFRDSVSWFRYGFARVE